MQRATVKGMSMISRGGGGRFFMNAAMHGTQEEAGAVAVACGYRAAEG